MDEHNQSIFPSYQGNFFNFHRRAGETPSALLPANCAPDASPDIRMHPKNNS